MPGGVFSTAKLHGMTIRESANDGSDFSNPDADYRRLFLGEDGELHVKDSAGAVTDPFSGSLPAGTGFPGGPSTDDIFYRTDRDLLYFYDGTRWLTTTLYDMPLVSSKDWPYTATSTSHNHLVPHAGVYDLWLENFQMAFFVVAGTALSGSHKWVCVLAKQPAAATVATVNIDSGASSVWRNSGQVAIGALVGTTNFQFDVVATKTGTPGNLYNPCSLTYRMVG